MSVPTSDRRRHLRVSVSVMGTLLRDAEEHPIVILSLSASGAMIQTHEEPIEGASYTLIFSLNKRSYELPFEVIHWVQNGDTFGWRGPFVGLSEEQREGIEKAVHAVAGVSTGSRREWLEVAAEAASEPHQKVLVGTTPAGHEIAILGQDVLDMGCEGVDLFARLVSELETL
jgi:hypothetical protein